MRKILWDSWHCCGGGVGWATTTTTTVAGAVAAAAAKRGGHCGEGGRRGWASSGVKNRVGLSATHIAKIFFIVSAGPLLWLILKMMMMQKEWEWIWGWGEIQQHTLLPLKFLKRGQGHGLHLIWEKLQRRRTIIRGAHKSNHKKKKTLVFQKVVAPLWFVPPTQTQTDLKEGFFRLMDLVF